MKTPFVARLATLGLLAAAIAPPLLAQDAGEFTRPRPRSAAEELPHLLPDGERPKLGVMVDETADGVLVVDIFEGSIADAAGVQGGDLLLNMNGHRIDVIEDIPETLAELRPGQGFSISVIREGEGLVKLEARMPEPRREPPRERRRAREREHRAESGFLGVYLGESTDRGVLLDEIIEGTSAWFVGLDDGDVLHAVNGQPVGSGEAVVEAISSLSYGEMVELSWVRDGETHDGAVRLGRRQPQNELFGRLDELPHLFTPEGNRFLWRGTPGSSPPPHFVMPRGPQGNAFVRPGPHGEDGEKKDGEERVFRFHGPEGLGFSFDGDFAFDGDWMDTLHEHLEELDLDLEGGTRLRIEIEDGKVTVDKDGEVTEYDLEELEDADVSFVRPSRARVLAVPGNGVRVIAPKVRARVEVERETEAECEAKSSCCEAGARTSRAQAPRSGSTPSCASQGAVGGAVGTVKAEAPACGSAESKASTGSTIAAQSAKAAACQEKAAECASQAAAATVSVQAAECAAKAAACREKAAECAEKAAACQAAAGNTVSAEAAEAAECAEKAAQCAEKAAAAVNTVAVRAALEKAAAAMAQCAEKAAACQAKAAACASQDASAAADTVSVQAAECAEKAAECAEKAAAVNTVSVEAAECAEKAAQCAEKAAACQEQAAECAEKAAARAAEVLVVTTETTEDPACETETSEACEEEEEAEEVETVEAL